MSLKSQQKNVEGKTRGKMIVYDGLDVPPDNRCPVIQRILFERSANCKNCVLSSYARIRKLAASRGTSKCLLSVDKFSGCLERVP